MLCSLYTIASLFISTNPPLRQILMITVLCYEAEKIKEREMAHLAPQRSPTEAISFTLLSISCSDYYCTDGSFTLRKLGCLEPF